MILFVFEGKDESYIFKTLEHLFFKKNERRICCFNQYIYELFRLMPLKKEDIRQLAIFRNQVYNYVNTKECCVSILNAFPLFLYEYFKQ